MDEGRKLTREQGLAAAEALMATELAEQAARHASVQEKRRSRSRWSGAGGLVGMSVGGLVAHWLGAHIFPWNLLGMALGIVAGYLKDSRAA